MFGSKLATSTLSMELAAGQPELAIAQIALTGIIFGIKKGVQHHREKKQRKADERQAQAEEQKRLEDIQFEEEKRRQEEEYQTAEQQRQQEQEQQAREQQRLIDQRNAEQRQASLNQLEQARLEENRQMIQRATSFSAGVLNQKEQEREVRIGIQRFDENGDSMSEEEDEYWSYIPGNGGGGNPGGNGGGGNPGGNGGNPNPNNEVFQGQGQPIGRSYYQRNPYFELIQRISEKIAQQVNKEKKGVEQEYEEQKQAQEQIPLGQDPATWSPNGKEKMPGQDGGGIYKGDQQQANGDNPGNQNYEKQEDIKQSLLDNQHLTQQELEGILMTQGEQELTEEDQLRTLNLIEQQLEIMRQQNVLLTPGSVYSSIIKRF